MENTVKFLYSDGPIGGPFHVENEKENNVGQADI